MNYNDINTNIKGKIGEQIASVFLKKSGYKILDTNFRYSRLGEIDIIARKKEYYCFIEVKARQNDKYGRPSEAVTYSKINKIRKIASIYINKHKLIDEMIRFDVIEIIYKIDGETVDVKELNHIENAF